MNQAQDSLDALQVIECLEIGPVKIEKRRITTPYQVIKGDDRQIFHLTYSYEEDVFATQDIATQNLANMIGAQLALNYGLFCKRIIFHGHFDDNDRRFLRDMAENTAREIYVKKFLEPNPFLTKDFGKRPVVKKKKYCQANIKFPDSKKYPKKEWQFWNHSKKRYAILSSGGKDSLLTYGVLDELGFETHPIYLNESGRHWFTALNAYRYFKNHVENTARVWVNSDRLFAWMLRHLPFLRQDFSNLRSDEYPIRLWTVAVFLFGSLPLIKKRGIGRLLIGDEFDTTNHTQTEGISHYDGLYDQSRHFDHAMSRYFLKKGWAVNQFSILRPLSEMLIEKILVKRYPHLFRHQISCHAAHKKEEKIRPCGKCEKCRRIVSMLTVLDADPKICGYTEEQIEQILKNIKAENIHQEEAGIQQLLFMLKEKGIIEDKNYKEHSEILHLRFDSEHSPFNFVPVDLRVLLYRIYLQYAQGALRKSKKQWKKFDPTSYPDTLQMPYPFDLEQQKTDSKRSSKENYLWGEMTWKEAELRFQETDIAILPVGAIEQHGPHLPLDTDSFDAQYLAEKVAQACSSPKPLVLPSIFYGVSYHHDHFKGTISIGNETLAKLVYDIGISVAKNGIKKLLIINGHGGNTPTLNHAAQMINRDSHIFVCVDTGETSDVDIDKMIETPNDIHSGEIETSTTLAVRPHLVKMQEARKEIPQFSNNYLDFTSKRAIPWHAYTHSFSKSGIMGDPTKATVEKGEKIWQIMISHLVAFIEGLKNLDLEQIYQQKY